MEDRLSSVNLFEVLNPELIDGSVPNSSSGSRHSGSSI